MSENIFKTIDEQLLILKSRGLHVDDEIIAKKFLLHNNYYRISGYSLTLRNHDKFYPGTSFENIIDIYEFDHELRHILLKYIEIIEVKIKSIYAYRFAEAFGGEGYLSAVYFNDIKRYNEIMAKAEEQKSKRLSSESYLKHFINDLNRPLPVWAFIDLLTIANISILYRITEENVKARIASDFGINSKNNADVLGALMKSMTIIRNLCAHGSRLYNRLFEQKPSLSKKEKKHLLINKGTGKIDNSHLYGFIFIMKKLLNECDFSNLKSDLIQLSESIPFVNMKHYGFREDWKQVL